MAAVAAACIVSCSKAPLLSNGGVSETTNGVAALILYPDGKLCTSAIVRLRSADYLTALPGGQQPSSVSIDSLTDNQGKLHIAGVGPGSYVIEVSDTLGNAIAIKADVPKLDTLIDLGVRLISPAGEISGTVVSSLSGQQVFVRLPGIECSVSVNQATGEFLLTRLPAGSYGLRFSTVEQNNIPASVESVTVIPAKDADLGDIRLGQQFKRIVLNTGTGGANVNETVTDFPVLIRLTSQVFDFSQVKSDGSDISFFRSGTVALVHQIERWDSASGTADIWVRLDTVFGNNDSQYVKMYWGSSAMMNPAATGVVFDTAAGFQAVWHFNEPGDAFCLDATQNQYTGTPYSMTAANAVSGAIGEGKYFDGSTSWIQAHGTAPGKMNFPENGSYTISAWVYLDNADTGSQVIISKGYWQYYLKAMHDSATGGSSWLFSEYHGTLGWQQTRTAATIQKWSYVVAKRSGGRQYLYVDGLPADSTVIPLADTMPRDTGNDFTIGRYIQAITSGPSEGFGYFHGALDEVCVSSVARNPAWIRLCYLNQNSDNTLVELK
jgi:hypothetical protein